MKGYRIALMVESDERYLKVLNFELRRWERREVFKGVVTYSMRQFSDGSYGLCIVGRANDEALIAFIKLILEERDKGNLSIYSIRLYEDLDGIHEEIVV